MTKGYIVTDVAIKTAYFSLVAAAFNCCWPVFTPKAVQPTLLRLPHRIETPVRIVTCFS
jgi:hypothetical protein